MDGMQPQGRHLLADRPARSRAGRSSSRRCRLAERAGAGPQTARAAFGLSLALFDEDPRAAVEVGPAHRGAVPPLRPRAAAPDDADEHGRGGAGGRRLGLAGGRARRRRPRRAGAVGSRDVRPGARRDRRHPGSRRGARRWPRSEATSPPRRIRRSPPVRGSGFGPGRPRRGPLRGRDPRGRRRPSRTTSTGRSPGSSRGAPRVRLGDPARARAALDRLDAGGSRGTAGAIHRDALAAGVAALDGPLAGGRGRLRRRVAAAIASFGWTSRSPPAPSTAWPSRRRATRSRTWRRARRARSSSARARPPTWRSSSGCVADRADGCRPPARRGDAVRRRRAGLTAGRLDAAADGQRSPARAGLGAAG